MCSFLTVSHPSQADQLEHQVLLFVFYFQKMIELIPGKDSHEVLFEQVLQISVIFMAQYELPVPLCQATQMINKPDAAGYLAVLGDILGWGPMIAPVSWDRAAKCRPEGTGHGPAQQAGL